jgi:hypothetical protein
VLDWNPDDPDTVKVHYDVSAWSLDQRAELAEALAEAELAHVWAGEEVVVPEELEAEADTLFARMEQLLGPFPVGLEEGDPGVEFGLDEWSPSDRDALAAALIEQQVPHRWEQATVIVATDAEQAVDELLDAIERGELALLDADGSNDPPDNALSTLYTSADRLARDPGDHGGHHDLLELAPRLSPRHPPFGVPLGVWVTAIESVDVLAAQFDDDDPDPSAIIGAAQELRAIVRPYV